MPPGVEPVRGEPAPKADTTIARNGPTVQPSDASAYAAPKAAIGPAERRSAGPGRDHRTDGMARPASSHAPSGSRANPRAIVNQGNCRCTLSATEINTRPNT